jgi:hypothetical protein
MASVWLVPGLLEMRSESAHGLLSTLDVRGIVTTGTTSLAGQYAGEYPKVFCGDCEYRRKRFFASARCAHPQVTAMFPVEETGQDRDGNRKSYLWGNHLCHFVNQVYSLGRCPWFTKTKAS